MELKLILSLIGMTLSIGAFIYYAHTIVTGKTKPHVYSWLVFSTLLFATFFMQSDFSGGVGTYVILAEAIGCGSIFLLALKYGEKDIKIADKISLSLAMISILLWLVLDMPVLSVILIIFVDIFGLFPTYRKSYMKPHEENMFMFFISGFIFLLSLLAIENYSFITMGQQLAVIFLDWGVVVFLLIRRHILSKT